MTLDEAQKVAKLLETADDNCRQCVGELAFLAQQAFPDFLWTFGDVDGSRSITVSAKGEIMTTESDNVEEEKGNG